MYPHRSGCHPSHWGFHYNSHRSSGDGRPFGTALCFHIKYQPLQHKIIHVYGMMHNKSEINSIDYQWEMETTCHYCLVTGGSVWSFTSVCCIIMVRCCPNINTQHITFANYSQYEPHIYSPWALIVIRKVHMVIGRIFMNTWHLAHLVFIASIVTMCV